MASVGGSGLGAVEFDVDEDGVQEIICPGGLPMYWTIYDKKPREEGAFLYTLNSMECGVTNIHFDPTKGGFVVADSQENVIVRYALQGDEMVRLPMTDFTALDYSDVAGTKLTFDLDYFYDSVDPDTVLYTESGVRVTPRQQAYLALQELYDLTGLKTEESYCAVSGIGSVCFSLLPDGLNERCFYSVSLPESYGGLGIPSLYLVWRELGGGVVASEAVRDEGIGGTADPAPHGPGRCTVLVLRPSPDFALRRGSLHELWRPVAYEWRLLCWRIAGYRVWPGFGESSWSIFQRRDQPLAASFMIYGIA